MRVRTYVWEYDIFPLNKMVAGYSDITITYTIWTFEMAYLTEEIYK